MGKRKYYYGGNISPTDPRDYTVATVGLHTQKIDLPETFIIENKPQILNQGSVYSCVAHACSTAINYVNGTDLSRGFIYGNRNENDYPGEGMVIREALSHLLHEGDMHNVDFPYNAPFAEVNKLIQETEDAYNHASVHSILNYFRMYHVDDVKLSLYNKKGVIILMPVHGTTLQVHSKKSTAKIIGYHAVAVIGWNKDGWICQNSWGSEWGDNGLFYVDYDYDITEFWGITADETDSPERQWVKTTHIESNDLASPVIKSDTDENDNKKGSNNENWAMLICKILYKVISKIFHL